MATRTSKTSTVKAKIKADTTSAPKVARARKSAAAAPVAVSASVTDEAVAMRAYERFCARGYVHGFDVDDWLAAEREMKST
jgi:DUF2934 family protein